MDAFVVSIGECIMNGTWYFGTTIFSSGPNAFIKGMRCLLVSVAMFACGEEFKGLINIIVGHVVDGGVELHRVEEGGVVAGDALKHVF